MYNKIIFLGNLTRDVELRYFPSGSAIATIGLASTKKFKGQDGSQKEEVCFVDCKLFGRTAEIANQWLRKGSKVLIEGRLNYETWTDNNGVKKSKHTILGESLQMIADPQQKQQQQQTPRYNQGQTVDMSAVTQPNIPEINIDDDLIPF